MAAKKGYDPRSEEQGSLESLDEEVDDQKSFIVDTVERLLSIPEGSVGQ